MSKISCDIIQDMLPLYYDEVCSADSRKMIEEHLQECEKCSNIFQKLKTECVVDTKENAESIQSSVMGKMAHSWKRSLLRSFIIGIVIISLDYITDEKHYPLGTTDEYFKAPEPDEEYIVHLCGDTVILSNGLLVQALSRLPAQKQEMLYLSFFKRMPQHEIGRRYGRSRSAAGYHIRKTIQQLYEEMEGLAHEE